MKLSEVATLVGELDSGVGLGGLVVVALVCGSEQKSGLSWGR